MAEIKGWTTGGAVSRQSFKPKAVALVFAIVLASLNNAVPANAQTFTILHTFTGADGNQPIAGLTSDRAGNFYGTTSVGGTGFGSVFKLSHTSLGWTFSNLYSFRGGSDGAQPQARVVFGPDGTLYGTTTYGGSGSGTVFNLRPQVAAACLASECPWIETVLYRFTGGSDGGEPYFGDLTFDSLGSIYGTASTGGGGCTGYGGCGVVFKLSRSAGSWTQSVVYAFSSGSSAGQTPFSSVIFDTAGNLYGTTFLGPRLGSGSVYQLTPSGSGWSENTLFTFGSPNQGANPYGGLTFDRQGNLYGTTFDGNSFGGGAVFQLQPSHGSWTYQVLAQLPFGPGDTPTMDASGDLYATTGVDAFGNVFELTPGSGGWTYTDLFDFSSSLFADGMMPVGGVVLDANGNIYGTTALGGSADPPCGEGCGVVWEITP